VELSDNYHKEIVAIMDDNTIEEKEEE